MSLAYCLGAPLGGLVEEVSLALAALLGVDTLGIRWIEPAPFWISLPLELALIGLIAAAIGLIAARRCRKRPYSAAAKAIAASHPQ
jgi:hypothetical protein